MNSEEQYDVFYNFFSDEAIESMFNNLPQETLAEMLQVIQLVDRKLARYKERIKELETNRY